jgi:plasmid maintenance system antidote protein VapI
VKALRKLVEAIGQREAARELGISRTKLRKLLENAFSGRAPEFMRRISETVAPANSRLDREKREISKLLKLAGREIRKVGTTEFARRLNCDPANLLKLIKGTRRLLASTAERLRAYFASKPLS